MVRAPRRFLIFVLLLLQTMAFVITPSSMLAHASADTPSDFCSVNPISADRGFDAGNGEPATLYPGHPCGDCCTAFSGIAATDRVAGPSPRPRMPAPATAIAGAPASFAFFLRPPPRGPPSA